MSRILVVEDDPAILRGLALNLEMEGHRVFTAADGEAGYALLTRDKPDMVILDLMLPKMSGFEFCRRARAQSVRVPILMLTARGDEVDRVRGLDTGADDYVTKPFSVAELLARVRALLRRTIRDAAHPLLDQLRLGDIHIDFCRCEATKAGNPLEMTPKELGLLRLLASRPGEVMTRDQLLDQVWGYDSCPSSRTVDNHIFQLRSKLEKNPEDPRHIVTVHRVGYRWRP